MYNFGSEEIEAFTYVGIGLKQNSNVLVKIGQNSYIDSIQERALLKERTKVYKNSLTPSEKTLYRSIVGQLNWVAGISQPDISFAVYESSTKFILATVADIIYVSKIIRKIKNSHCFLQFPKLDLNIVKLQLFTDTSFNNLSIKQFFKWWQSSWTNNFFNIFEKLYLSTVLKLIKYMMFNYCS